MNPKLTKEERRIERSSGAYRPVSGKVSQRIEATLDQIRKKKNVNIRISEMVLDELKKRSREEGIPYQTLISSVLHKFITGRLVDERAIRKSLRVLSLST